jgi:prevent-host-death family protein
MTVKTLESRSARENWRDLLDSATAGQTDIVITRYGKPVTAMIRYEDYVAVQDELVKLRAQQSEAYQTMLASESALAREWDSPEEDEAWADL